MCQGFETEFFFGWGGGLRIGRSVDETFGSAL